MARGVVRVPAQHRAVLQFIAQLNDADLKQWFAALAALSADSLLSGATYGEAIAKSDWLKTQDQAEAVVRVLSSMNGAMVGGGTKAADFVSDLVDSLAGETHWDDDETKTIDEGQLDAVRVNLLKLIQVPSIVTASRVSYQSFENERSVIFTAVLTELRPAVSENADQILALAPAHRIKLTYYSEGVEDPQEMYFSLDSNDIRSLIEHLEKALKTEQLLADFVQQTAVPFLSMGGQE